jgi:hypothetical protein
VTNPLVTDPSTTTSSVPVTSLLSSVSASNTAAISTITPVSVAGQHSPAGAIAGGIVGGVVALLLLLCLLVWLWRRMKKSASGLPLTTHLDLNEGCHVFGVEPFVPEAQITNGEYSRIETVFVLTHFLM